MTAPGTTTSTRPQAFTTQPLDWLPWLEPPTADELTDAQRAGLVQPSRAASPYFRLLAEDPAVLEARTRADLDIFHARGGLPRAERELAATVASRLNGCVYCAHVHASFAASFSRRRADVERLLAAGVEDGGAAAGLDERWSAVVDAAAALTRTPSQFSPAHVSRLRAAGLDDAAIVDVINAAAFFAWANRLMLSLGEPRLASELPSTPTPGEAPAGPRVPSAQGTW